MLIVFLNDILPHKRSNVQFKTINVQYSRSIILWQRIPNAYATNKKRILIQQLDLADAGNLNLLQVSAARPIELLRYQSRLAQVLVVNFKRNDKSRICLVTAWRSNQFINKKCDPTRCASRLNVSIIRTAIKVEHDTRFVANVVFNTLNHIRVIRRLCYALPCC
nr:hyp [Cotesia vestalis bracovirus]